MWCIINAINFIPFVFFELRSQNLTRKQKLRRSISTFSWKVGNFDAEDLFQHTRLFVGVVIRSSGSLSNWLLKGKDIVLYKNKNKKIHCKVNIYGRKRIGTLPEDFAQIYLDLDVAMAMGTHLTKPKPPRSSKRVLVRPIRVESGCGGHTLDFNPNPIRIWNGSNY